MERNTLLRTIREEPFFRRLDSSLNGLIPSEPLEFLGDWSTWSRKTYVSESQSGTGAGPFIEVEDRRWTGTLTSRAPISGIIFLVTPSTVYWVKAPTVATTLSVGVSLHAHAGYSPGRATFGAELGGACLPSVSVAAPGNVDDVCTRGRVKLTTGRVVTLARTDDVAFVAIVLPNNVLRVGRNRLWRVRDDVASPLAADVRTLLTRRRSGSFDISHPRPAMALGD